MSLSDDPPFTPLLQISHERPHRSPSGRNVQIVPDLTAFGILARHNSVIRCLSEHLPMMPDFGPQPKAARHIRAGLAHDLLQNHSRQPNSVRYGRCPLLVYWNQGNR